MKKNIKRINFLANETIIIDGDFSRVLTNEDEEILYNSFIDAIPEYFSEHKPRILTTQRNIIGGILKVANGCSLGKNRDNQLYTRLYKALFNSQEYTSWKTWEIEETKKQEQQNKYRRYYRESFRPSYEEREQARRDRWRI